jgi:hypothetical protein
MASIYKPEPECAPVTNQEFVNWVRLIEREHGGDPLAFRYMVIGVLRQVADTPMPGASKPPKPKPKKRPPSAESAGAPANG